MKTAIKTIKMRDGMLYMTRQGKKTQTRRVIRPQPLEYEWIQYIDSYADQNKSGFIRYSCHDRDRTKRIECPYGVPGDLLIIEGTDTVIKITRLSVQRLDCISKADILKEGIFKWAIGYGFYEDRDLAKTRSFTTAIGAFACLWTSIYGWESLRDNPWVWVIEYELEAA